MARSDRGLGSTVSTASIEHPIRHHRVVKPVRLGGHRRGVDITGHVDHHIGGADLVVDAQLPTRPERNLDQVGHRLASRPVEVGRHWARDAGWEDGEEAGPGGIGHCYVDYYRRGAGRYPALPG